MKMKARAVVGMGEEGPLHDPRSELLLGESAKKMNMGDGRASDVRVCRSDSTAVAKRFIWLIEER